MACHVYICLPLGRQVFCRNLQSVWGHGRGGGDRAVSFPWAMVLDAVLDTSLAGGVDREKSDGLWTATAAASTPGYGQWSPGGDNLIQMLGDLGLNPRDGR